MPKALGKNGKKMRTEEKGICCQKLAHSGFVEGGESCCISSLLIFWSFRQENTTPCRAYVLLWPWHIPKVNNILILIETKRKCWTSQFNVKKWLNHFEWINLTWIWLWQMIAIMWESVDRFHSTTVGGKLKH